MEEEVIICGSLAGSGFTMEEVIFCVSLADDRYTSESGICSSSATSASATAITDVASCTGRRGCNFFFSSSPLVTCFGRRGKFFSDFLLDIPGTEYKLEIPFTTAAAPAETLSSNGTLLFVGLAGREAGFFGLRGNLMAVSAAGSSLNVSCELMGYI
jgi:hypothetical protein